MVVIPLVWWNANHDWATIRFNFQIRQSNRQGSLLNLPEYLLGQFAALSPGICAFAGVGTFLSLRDWWRTRARSSLFLGLFILLPVGYFLFVSLTRRVGIHWPVAGSLRRRSLPCD